MGLHGRLSYQAQHSTRIYGCIYVCMCAKSLQSCPTLCDAMDCSPPGSSVHGIFLARILEWVGISFSRGSFQPKDSTLISCVSCIADSLPTEPTGKPVYTYTCCIFICTDAYVCMCVYVYLVPTGPVSLETADTSSPCPVPSIGPSGSILFPPPPYSPSWMVDLDPYINHCVQGAGAKGSPQQETETRKSEIGMLTSLVLSEVIMG